MRFNLLFCFGILFGLHCKAQIPGKSLKESPDLKHLIQDAMLKNDSASVLQGFNRLKAETGKYIGTATQDPIYKAPDSSEISTEELQKVWNGALDQLMVWEMDCPEPGTSTPAAMLGVYLASTTANQGIPQERLSMVGKMLEAQQYNSRNCSLKNRKCIGAFGLVHVAVNEACTHSGNIQRSTMTMCRDLPENCPLYKSGLFAGKSFTVADQVPELDIWDGSIAFHQGWAVEEMIQSYLFTGESAFLEAAVLGGDWCLNEVPVLNHQYSAKMIWALAALYDLTGDVKWKNGMLLFLKNNLLHGILMDQNKDGMVDGADQIAFDSLAPYSRSPGRMWNEQNASSWNTAICAWALAEAYASFRNHGDSLNSRHLRPYVISMMDNLCFEINHFGTPPSGSGFRDLAYGIMNILWCVDKAENLKNPEWRKASNILWNARVLQRGGEFTVNIGQFIRFNDSQSEYKSRKKMRLR